MRIALSFNMNYIQKLLLSNILPNTLKIIAKIFFVWEIQGVWSRFLNECQKSIQKLFKYAKLAVIRRYFVKRCSQKFRKIHKKTTVPESLFNKVADPRPATLLKKRLWHRCFPMNFVKFLRTPFFIEHLGWVFL